MVQANDNSNYGAKLSGAYEVAAAVSSGSGNAKFNFSSNGMAASFHVNEDGISDVRFSHIHFAKAGLNGSVVYTLRIEKVVGPVSGLYATGEIMPSEFSGQLLSGGLFILRKAFRTGNAYVNLHTDKFPGGELRGQIN